MAILTTNDILKINNSEEIVGVISEVIQGIPELGYFGASPVTRNTFKTLCVTAPPDVAFRTPGTERTFSTATLDNKTIELKFLDASWIAEKSICEASDWGKETAIAIQQKEHLKAALFTVAQQIWKGTNAGFNGFNSIISTANCAVVDSGNTGISDGSCVYAVSTGLDSAQLCWGNEGKLYEGDVVEQLLTTTTSGVKKGMWFYAQDISGWVGLQVTSKWAGGMITGLSATNGKAGLTDDLIYALIEKFPIDKQPTALFMNRRSLAQLRKSRTATNATGAPAPLPTEVEGIPIYVTDAIGSSDTVA
jgi:hypothetical protein